jgi:hypothetical protein
MALLLGLAACGSDGDGAAGPGSSAGRPSDPRPALALDFDPGSGAGDAVVEVVNDGSTAVSVAVAASGAVTLESKWARRRRGVAHPDALDDGDESETSHDRLTSTARGTSARLHRPG